MIGILESNEKIVTNALLMHLDAAQLRSYPGTGTSWTDLSNNSNNGTLTNGPTFNSGNGGSIVLDGINDTVGCTNNASLQITQGTISVWVKSTTPGNGLRGIIVKQNNYSLFFNNSVLVTYDWGNTATRSTGINIADGNWNNVAMTFTTNTGTPNNNAIIYLNGNSVLTTTVRLLNNTVALHLGSGSPTSQYLNGSISHALVYSRALTSTEILQNYNALKTRYI
jgi:hypothetical protein